MPTFLHPLRPNPASILTLRKLTVLLTPSFSPEGSNRKKFETEVYSLFVKYLREAASKFHNTIYMGHTCMLGAVSQDLHLLATYTMLLRMIFQQCKFLASFFPP